VVTLETTRAADFERDLLQLDEQLVQLANLGASRGN
jgi:hypothetical protein